MDKNCCSGKRDAILTKIESSLNSHANGLLELSKEIDRLVKKIWLDVPNNETEKGNRDNIEPIDIVGKLNNDILTFEDTAIVLTKIRTNLLKLVE